MHLTWFGHSSFKLEYQDKVIYIDPSAGNLEWYDKQASLILISKDEYEHFNRSIVKKISGDNTHIIGGVDVASELYGCRPLRAGEHITFEDETTIQAMPAKIERRTTTRESIGWLLTIEKKNYYFTGDTDILPARLDVDTVLVPVGSTWSMKAKHAATAVKLLNPKRAIPLWYASRDDAELFSELVQPVEVVILMPGKEVQL
ncbi:MBL fold metallo-hydrolase [Candidatus Woesearchaeota archaeon]|nr:MBL fold metallo-hydrolase [Candidatus Woesearchaeota archaeon]